MSIGSRLANVQRSELRLVSLIQSDVLPSLRVVLFGTGVTGENIISLCYSLAGVTLVLILLHNAPQTLDVTCCVVVHASPTCHNPMATHGRRRYEHIVVHRTRSVVSGIGLDAECVFHQRNPYVRAPTVPGTCNV